MISDRGYRSTSTKTGLRPADLRHHLKIEARPARNLAPPGTLRGSGRFRVHMKAEPSRRSSTSDTVWRALLVLVYAAAGVLHLAAPQPFASIVPPWVPAPALVVALTGVAEIAGAVGLGQGWSMPLRRAAGWGLAAYALCVWPANLQHMLIDLAHPEKGLPLTYHVPRLLLQPVLIWWALRAGGVTRWPQRDRAQPEG